jgi:hypothetical protein
MKVKKYSFKPAALAIVACMALLSLSAEAQEVRSEISVQGTGFFTKDSNGNGIENKATETGGLLIGYRYNITRWLAPEANYGYDRNTQGYIGSTSGRAQSNNHQITGSAVVKLPGFARIQPYALAGGGGLIFDPTGNAGGTFAGATRRREALSFMEAAPTTPSRDTFRCALNIAASCTNHRASTWPASRQTRGRILRSRLLA